MIKHNKKPISGFSIIELAVVLVIISSVVGVSMSAGITQMRMVKIQGTKNNIALLSKSLELFKTKNGRYPCPALQTDSPADASYGLEATGCDAACPAGLYCSFETVSGVIPYKTLNANDKSAFDGWDNKITYVIDKDHTVSSTDSDLGDLTINDASGNSLTQSTYFGDAIYIIISHGEDNLGAYSKMGVLNPCSAVRLDRENCDADTVFIDASYNNSIVNVKYFDDLILWKTQGHMN